MAGIADIAGTTGTLQPNTAMNYYQPQYYTDTGASLAGGVQDLLGNNGYINDIANNWNTITPGSGPLSQFAQFDPNQQQQFQNPYVQNVVNEQARLSNQNLFDNILPQVNSTFTGAGQFGSTRHGDFMGKAIRDQQQTLTGAMGQTLFNAQNMANSQYKDWTQMGVNAGNQDQANWMTQANFPISALAQVSQMFGNMKSPTPASTMGVTGDASTLQKLAAALGALNTGANDGTISSLLSALNLGGSTDTSGTNTGALT